MLQAGYKLSKPVFQSLKMGPVAVLISVLLTFNILSFINLGTLFIHGVYYLIN